jgi:hypothetical protein
MKIRKQSFHRIGFACGRPPFAGSQELPTRAHESDHAQIIEMPRLKETDENALPLCDRK